MEPRHVQRFRETSPVRRGSSARDEPAGLSAVIAAMAQGRRAGLSATSTASIQRLIGNGAMGRVLAGSAAGSATPAVQRFRVDSMKQEVGKDLREKHVGTEAMPDVSTADARDQAVAAVYYQRAREDRRTKNTVFFVDPATLFADLRETNKDTDLRSGPDYTTTNSYPAISVLVVGKTNKDSEGRQVKGAVSGPFVKFEIEHGQAKPMVRINKDGGLMAFNHLQETSPKTLGTKVDVLKDEG
ncbi:hypothetical protein [Occultella kanbiaonis]|uniref:hypothetical protein n=1 Tax=Occultella kanbiaonis TaxID=2675754 RepID=UPI0012B9AEF7|nr:hypothetical protein [Occultella kanbiaonis]